MWRTIFPCLIAAAAGASGCSSASSSGPGAPGSAGPGVESDGGAPSGAIDLPGGSRGAGLDDVRYSPSLRRLVIAPGGAGAVDLIDPDTLDVASIPGFDPSVASADEGDGWIFAVDRAHGRLQVADPTTKRIVASIPCAARPDYVRYSRATREAWVTEPSAGQIEVFAIPKTGAPNPVHVAAIAVPSGPEGLAFDTKRRRAYAHRYDARIVAIDVEQRSIVGTWPTGCGSSHGIPAVDEARGFVFAGCAESATVVVLDADRGGKELGRSTLGSGETLLAYSPALGHLYVRGDPGLPVAILAISATGAPTPLGTVRAANSGHCMTADDRGTLYVCDARGGRLLRFQDTFAGSAP